MKQKRYHKLRRNKIKAIYSCPQCGLNCTNKEHLYHLKYSINGFFEPYNNTFIFKLSDRGIAIFKSKFDLK